MSYEYKHKDLIKGIVDIHLHVSPSLIPRRLDIAEMAQIAHDYEYKAIVQKDHHALTSHCAYLVKHHLFKDSPIQVFGAICLNNSVGGLKKEVVESAIGFGAKIIWLPTVSAVNHIEFVKKTGKFPKLAKGVTIDETPIHYVDSNGKCRKEIVDIFEIISKHPDVVLASGHGDPNEINEVVEKAAAMGMSERFIIDHPTWMVEASLDQVKRWAGMGCYIEHTAALSAPISPHKDIPMKDLVELIRLVGPERSLISSDYGQADNCHPAEGMDDFFDALLKEGVTEDEIVLMSNTIPSKLLGLN